jgi:hydantoinase/carbamoylase family amidase
VSPPATVLIDRERSSERIERDIETLATARYTSRADAICRYAYTDVYRNALRYLADELEGLGFQVGHDPVGTLVARNRPHGEPAFGVGSHCDSNRNGGKYDGTMGVVAALEVCRLNQELGLDLPIQLVSFLEEEGSGFGRMLLGSQIMAQRVSEEDLRERIHAIDDSRSFWDHAREAGFEPGRWRESRRALDGLTGWIEVHIEQGRVLQDTGNRIGVVTAIAGYVHADVTVAGRADHAGATPMEFRQDAGVVAGETIVELERLARSAGKGTVGTVGEIHLTPGIINVVPGGARFSLDIRGVDEDAFGGVAHDIRHFAEASARRRGMQAGFTQRQVLPVTTLDQGLVTTVEEAARQTGERYRVMHSGAAHDTMCVAPLVPSAMLFVPCKDGVSHSPLEDASPADAALATEIVLNAVRAWHPS